jgi:hypothetical protein
MELPGPMVVLLPDKSTLDKTMLLTDHSICAAQTFPPAQNDGKLERRLVDTAAAHTQKYLTDRRVGIAALVRDVEFGQQFLHKSRLSTVTNQTQWTKRVVPWWEDAPQSS